MNSAKVRKPRRVSPHQHLALVLAHAATVLLDEVRRERTHDRVVGNGAKLRHSCRDDDWQPDP